MKKIIFTTTLFVSFFSANINAVSLNGTSSLVYQSTSYTPAKSDSVTGFVRLNAGFNAPKDGAVIMDTITSVSGLMYGTEQNSTVSLKGSLRLSSKAKFSGAFNISGYKNPIFLDGDLTLPANKVIRFATDTIIDGCGNTLTFTTNSQLLIESNATLTLRNMKIKTTQSRFGTPCIRGIDNTTRLALDNVAFALADDFNFNQGRLYIHNNVRITGTSRFQYSSTQASYITPGALFAFDPNTTLCYYPSTAAQDLIRLADQSAGLYLNNATLQMTYTGMLLSKGRIWLDNNVSIDSLSLPPTGNVTAFGSYGSVPSDSSIDGYSLSWRYDSQYVALASTFPLTRTVLQIYNWDGTSATLATQTPNFAVGTTANTIQWSPSGKLLTAGLSADSNNFADFRVYTFTSNSLTITTSLHYAHAPFGSTTLGGVFATAWHPSEQFLAFGGTSDLYPDIVLLGVNGNSFTITSSQFIPYSNLNFNLTYGGVSSIGINSLSWSSDGTYLAVGTKGRTQSTNGPTTQNALLIYKFDGKYLSLVASGYPNQNPGLTSGPPLVCRFSPDNKYVAIGMLRNPLSSKTILQVYSFQNNTLTLITSLNDNSTTAQIADLSWSHDGQYILTSGSSLTSSSPLQIRSFNGTNLVLKASFGSTSLCSAWSPDGNWTICGGGAIYPLTWVQVVYGPPAASTNTASLGLTLGNASEGSASNLSTYILGDARVEVAGRLVDESV